MLLKKVSSIDRTKGVDKDYFILAVVSDETKNKTHGKATHSDLTGTVVD